MNDSFDANGYIDIYIRRAREAQAVIADWDQSQIDNAVKTIAGTVFDHAESLAELAVSETGMGVISDKTAKNRGKARMIWHDLKGKKSIGILSRNLETGITEIAKPIGVVAAITPMTNPIVTPMSNAMFAVKGGNAIVITPHHRAVRCSSRTVALINEALAKIGAPEHLIQILDIQSRENTKALIAAADIVIATGGGGMVKAAYSSGRPALGVGTGNVQCIVDDDADFAAAAQMIVTGRTFDHGILCSAEQSVIVSGRRYPEMVQALRAEGVKVVEGAVETSALRSAIFDADGKPNRHLVGQSATEVLKTAGLVSAPEGSAPIRAVAALADGPGDRDILSKEKMCPVLALYKWSAFEEAVDIAAQNLESDGKGHSVSIHSHAQAHIEYAALRLPVSRFIINQCAALSAGGSFHNGLTPTNTLGCGSWGGNSISENLTYRHLINISRIAEYMPARLAPDDAAQFD